MLRVLSAVVLSWSIGCGAGSEPHGSASSLCPIIPMQLVVDIGSGQHSVMFEVDASGTVRSPLAPNEPVGSLDTRGCVVGSDGKAVVDLAGDVLWMHRQTAKVEGDRIVPEGGRSIEITPDGMLLAYSADGQPEPATGATMRLMGFSEAGRCAGTLLVGTMLGSFGGISMAVADGVAKHENAPASSACPELHTRP